MALGHLEKSVCSNHHLCIDTKTSVHRVNMLSSLLYGSEIWTPHEREFRAFHRFYLDDSRKTLQLLESRKPKFFKERTVLELIVAGFENRSAAQNVDLGLCSRDHKITHACCRFLKLVTYLLGRSVVDGKSSGIPVNGAQCESYFGGYEGQGLFERKKIESQVSRRINCYTGDGDAECVLHAKNVF
ncbi:hypothetical protein CLF_105835 [Clonorchis sinensis]|uniref:Uncharacterized protein n=1 Tax=Clonorchis sinensis TaxID=79923 RepID=G7YPG7_CLOSI|nr:hypothetical protein CLF_105835 [Clonorchis sinensis]